MEQGSELDPSAKRRRARKLTRELRKGTRDMSFHFRAGTFAAFLSLSSSGAALSPLLQDGFLGTLRIILMTLSISSQGCLAGNFWRWQWFHLIPFHLSLQIREQFRRQ